MKFLIYLRFFCQKEINLEMKCASNCAGEFKNAVQFLGLRLYVTKVYIFSIHGNLNAVINFNLATFCSSNNQ